MLDGSSFREHGLELEYDTIVVQINGIRQRLATLFDENAGFRCSPREFDHTIAVHDDEAQDIDKALQVWTSHFPKFSDLPTTYHIQRGGLPDGRFSFFKSLQLLQF